MDFNSNIRDLVLSLENLSALTEKIYLGLGTTYPALLTELKKGMTASDQIFRTRKSGTNEESLTGSFGNVFNFMNEGNASLRKMSQEDRALHDKLQERLKDIQELERFIIQIKDDSGAMELISLNAMTVALKAGTHGRAFSIITEELKRLSGRTMELTDRLNDRGRRVIANFQVFQAELERLENRERQIVEGFETDSGSCMQNMQDSLRQMETLMQASTGICTGISQRLGALISTIQSQDIIRQSIDHVIMALKELLTTSVEAMKNEDMLDALSFHEQLPELCISVLGDIKKINEESRVQFATNLGAIKTETDRLIAAHANIRTAADNASAHSSIRNAFGCSKDMFTGLSRNLTDLVKAKGNSVSYSQDLERQVRELDEDFRSFESIITRFQTVDIASRIEIAKQQVLKEMSSTVDEMTMLTSHIKEDVEAATAITGTFLRDTHAYLSAYRNFNNQRNQTVQEFILGIEKRNQQFQTIQEDLFLSFRQSESTTQVFCDEFGKTSQDIDRIAGLSREFDQLAGKLRTVKAGISQRKADLMREMKVSTWSIHNRRLTEMIERFTIFTHKKAAAEIGGFEVEDGLKAGEVTLF